MRRFAVCGLMIFVACTPAIGAEAISEKPADWTHRAAIRADSIPEKGLVEFALTPEIFDLARTDFSDLRVFSENGEAAPYVLRASKEHIHTSVDLPVKLYNRTYVPGKQTSVTADFGSKALKNRIEVVTPGTNFRRSVVVEGCDDGVTWQKLREGAFLFRVSAGPAGAEYDKKAIELTENDLRYLRITVFNAPDDPKHLQIASVTASRRVETPPETKALPIVGSEVTQKEKEQATEIVLDFGHQNLPLHEVTLSFTDKNFFRYVRVDARNRTERVVMTPVEDGPPRPKTVEEPWQHVARSAIYRYSSGSGVEDSLTLNLQGTRTRYIRIRIADADDPPLKFQTATANRLVHHLAFKPKANDACFLYLGNTEAVLPRYDLPHYAEALRKQGVVAAALGPVDPNPLYGPEEKPLSWSERYAGAIWVALLAAAAVLGLLVYRQMKAGPQPSD